MSERCLAFLVLALAACDETLVCGEGTIEVDGVCENGQPVSPTCGAATTYDPVSGTCVSSLLADDTGRCGPNTVRQVGEDGVPVCVGIGGGDCSADLPCLQPGAGQVSVCGRLFDLETTAPISDTTASAVQIAFLDALTFATTGTGTPLVTIQPDQCGRFSQVSPAPPSGIIAIATDDRDGGPDDHSATGVAFPLAGPMLERINAYVTRRSTEDAWKTAAGDPFAGARFSDVGVFVPIFIDTNATPVGPFAGAPVEGTTVAVAGVPLDDANDFYFADTDVLTRVATLASASRATGVNGTALVVREPLQQYGGNGPAGCTWPNDLAATVAGAIYVQEKLGTCN